MEETSEAALSVQGRLPPPHFTGEAKDVFVGGCEGVLPKVVICTRSASLFLFRHKRT